MKTDSKSLKERWQELLASEPKLRIRDAADRLGVSEAELLATDCGSTVTRLEADWKKFIQELPKLGRVMCLTRNEHAVHERYGQFRDIHFFSEHVGQVVGPDIDLRIFPTHWHFGFAVTQQTEEGPRYSFQFFDADGTAVHKVYLQPEGNEAAYHDLVTTYRSENQSPTVAVKPAQPPRPELPDHEIDMEGFRAEWLAMKDTHHFFIMLGKFRVAREQALRLAPEGYAEQVEISAARQMLETAAARELPIMVFIGNKGCIQIHTGPVKNIKMFGKEWLNVLDDEFNMHLRITSVARAWIVRKPTVDGDVHSLELYDDKGNELVMFFGKRKPGEPELEEWRQLLSELPRVESVTA